MTNVVVRGSFAAPTAREGRRTSTGHLAWPGFERPSASYETCMATHGPDKPWIIDYPMAPFGDVEFPIWMMN